MKIGIIGAGGIAQAIAKQALGAGYEVVLSNSRGPETLKAVVQRLGGGAAAGSVREAAQADLVVLAVQWSNVAKALGDCRTGTAAFSSTRPTPPTARRSSSSRSWAARPRARSSHRWHPGRAS